jgi:enamine deaminase RidA (YjgF/YER057c/UK114 family)
MIQTVHPPNWPRPNGYANGVLAEGRLVFVAGQVGWDERGQFQTDDFVAQVRQALANVVAVLRAAGAEPQHLARLTWYITDKAVYRASMAAVGRAYREVVGSHYPAMTLVEVKALLEDRAQVEIEATAVVPL